jgi:hypothetical protein
MTTTYCPCGEPLHTKHCLAALFKCKPRAVVRMAKSGRWPSTRLPVGATGAGEYRFTNEMIAQIISDGEQWPEKTANESAPQQTKAVKAPQPTPRRTRQPQPAPNPGSNVRPLVAKGRRLGRSA